MITKTDFWKLIQGELRYISRSQLLTKKVMDSIKEADIRESEEAGRSCKKSS
jgi:hypothetical protein